MATVKKAKPAVKRKAPVKAKETTSPKETFSEMPEMSSPMAVSVKRKYVITVAAIILVLALLYYFRSLFVVALVNGQPISRVSIIQQLEQQGGKQTLNVAVTRVLIEQEARKKNVSVSQAQVDAAIKKTESSLASQGQTLDQGLAAAGMTRAQYEDQVRLQQLVDKMVGKDIKVTDKEINDYIEQNKSQIPEGSNMTEIKKTVSEQLKQQKLSTKVQAWLAQLQKDAKITYFLNY